MTDDRFEILTISVTSRRSCGVSLARQQIRQCDGLGLGCGQGRGHQPWLLVVTGAPVSVVVAVVGVVVVEAVVEGVVVALVLDGDDDGVVVLLVVVGAGSEPESWLSRMSP
jgi:hypothetical protein